MAVEIAISVVGKIAEYLVVPIGRQFGYLFCYNRNIENMRTQVEMLKDKKLEVQGDVDVARRNCESIRADVTTWLTSVNENEEDANRILEDEEMVGRGCLNGWCPNIKSRYLLSRKASKKTQNIKGCLDGGKFEKVSYPPKPMGIVPTPPTPMEIVLVSDMGMPSTSKGSFGGFKSRSLITRDVLKSLKDDKVRVIGIWGMGGVGKTTMAKEVVERAKKEGVFDEVVMVVVSQKPELKKVQGDIAELLGLRLEEQSLSTRAGRLHQRLTQKGQNDKPTRILVILDDVWESLNLEEVGIPSANDHNGCKILLTSREKDVCDGMRTDKIYSVEVLTTEEACDLFQKTAGISPDATDLFQIAEDIVEECRGLPMAITTIAKALVNKDILIWNRVLKKLKRSALDGRYAIVYETFQVSYDFLPTEEIKAFFTLCCLFQEDFDIPIEDLVKYGVGLKILRNISTLHEAREEAHEYAKMLRNSNLFIDSAVVDCIKVHDLVRDFALSNASKGRFLVRFGNEMKCPVEDTYEQYISISLQCDKMDGILDGKKCPNLELLRLAGLDSGSLKFPERFFEGMRKLQVLVLGHVSIQSLPGSLQLPKSLRTLSLNSCRLEGDVSVIEKLEVLEILSLAHSEIQDLPIEIGKLSRLRLLDLTGSRKLHRVAPGILSSLIHLEELYLRGTSIRWAEHVHANLVIHGDGAAHDDGGGVEKNARFAELKALSSLVVLEIDIPDEVLPVDLIFLVKLEKLEKFYVCVGATIEKEIKHGFQNTLCCEVDTGVLFEGVFNVLCRKTEVLYLRVKDLKNLQKEVEREDFLKLRDLDLISCDEMVFLVNTLGRLTTKVFPKLESLRLCDMRNLEHICLSQTSNRSLNIAALSSMNELALFGNLRRVEVNGCHKLKTIFSLSIAKGLINLRSLDVGDCRAMEEVFMKESGNEDEEEARKIVLLRLERLHLYNLPNLVGFCKAVAEIELPQLEELHLFLIPKITSIYSKAETLDSELQQASSNHPLFIGKVNTNNMARLELEEMENLKEIWPTHFQFDDCISKLERIRLHLCQRLLNVFPSNMLQGLQNLESLSVKNCEMMDAILWKERGEDEAAAGTAVAKIQFPHLKEVDFYYLPNLVHFCKSFEEVEFPQLEEVYLENLKKLGGFASKGVLFNTKQVQNLRELYIQNCGSLEKVFDLQRSNVNEGCHELTALTELDINACGNLVAIVAKEEEEEEEECIVKGGGGGGETFILFPQLTTLSLGNLPKLLTITPKPTYSFNWTCLKYLTLNGSRKLLETFNETTLQVTLDNLETLVFWNINDVTVFFPTSLQHLQLQNLQKLQMGECRSLEVVFDLQVLLELINNEGHQELATLTQLTHVRLYDLPCLTHVWRKGPHAIQGPFRNLSSLRVNECGSLSHVFTPSMAKLLLRLENLEIYDCNNLEAIVAKDGEEEEEWIVEGGGGGGGGIIFLFPHLTNLSLGLLPKLLTITPKPYSFNWPSLKKLTLKNCDELPNDIRQVTLDNLETLEFGDINEVTVFFPTSLPHHQLHNLQKLQILWCRSLEVVFDLPGFLELINNEGHQERATLTQLTHVQLLSLPSLTHVWRKGPHAIRGPFRNLSSLRVDKCGSLRHVFTPSMAKLLSRLENLEIENCKNLEAIVAKDGEEEEDLIVEEGGGIFILFPQLTSLSLKKLPKLLTVTPKPYSFNWSSLKKLTLNDCDKLTNDIRQGNQFRGDSKICALRIEEIEEMRE